MAHHGHRTVLRHRFGDDRPIDARVTTGQYAAAANLRNILPRAHRFRHLLQCSGDASRLRARRRPYLLRRLFGGATGGYSRRRFGGGYCPAGLLRLCRGDGVRRRGRNCVFAFCACRAGLSGDVDRDDARGRPASARSDAGAALCREPAGKGARPCSRFRTSRPRLVLGNRPQRSPRLYFTDRRRKAGRAIFRSDRAPLHRNHPQTDRQRRERGADAGLQPVVANALSRAYRACRSSGRRAVVVNLGQSDRQ